MLTLVIHSFDIYIDTANPPTTRIKANHTTSSINHAINSAGILLESNY